MLQSMSKEILAERMIKKGTVLEHLNETYIAFVYFTKPTKTFILSSNFELFFLKNPKDLVFLILLGTKSQIFGAREDMVQCGKYCNFI